MNGIRDRCPRCDKELLRFPVGETRTIPCPRCHAAIEVSEQGFRLPALLQAPRRPARSGRMHHSGDAAGEQGEGAVETATGYRYEPRFVVMAAGLMLVAVMGVVAALFGLQAAVRPPPREVAPQADERVALVESESTSGPRSAVSTGPSEAAAELDTRAEARARQRAAEELRRAEPAGDGSKEAARPGRQADGRQSQAPREPIPESLVAAVRKVSPSVVTIVTATTDELGLGSGFIVKSRRLLATNHHVIARAARAIAIQRNADGTDAIARDIKGFVACEPRADLVLLALAEDWPADPLAITTDKAPLGTNVFAVGSPHGLSGTITRGIVSGGRTAAELDLSALAPRTAIVQTDAFFTHGSSGGPLCDNDGRVVGVTTFGWSYGRPETPGEHDVVRFAIAAQELGRLLDAGGDRIRPLAELPRVER